MEKEMEEGRKRTLGVIAAIFACRKLSVLDGKPSTAREMAFRDSIDLAAPGDDAPDRFEMAVIEAVEANLPRYPVANLSSIPPVRLIMAGQSSASASLNTTSTPTGRHRGEIRHQPRPMWA